MSPQDGDLIKKKIFILAAGNISVYDLFLNNGA